MGHHSELGRGSVTAVPTVTGHSTSAVFGAWRHLGREAVGVGLAGWEWRHLLQDLMPPSLSLGIRHPLVVPNPGSI